MLSFWGLFYNFDLGKLGWIKESMIYELFNLGKWFMFSNLGIYEDMFQSNLYFMECYF